MMREHAQRLVQRRPDEETLLQARDGDAPGLARAESSVMSLRKLLLAHEILALHRRHFDEGREAHFIHSDGIVILVIHAALEFVIILHIARFRL